MRQLINEATGPNQSIRLDVVKANRALRLYTKLGFEITHDDNRKFYMTRGPA
jgi:ribosomal protein S18 acetylase RimI-like enzyme